MFRKVCGPLSKPFLPLGLQAFLLVVKLPPLQYNILILCHFLHFIVPTQAAIIKQFHIKVYSRYSIYTLYSYIKTTGSMPDNHIYRLTVYTDMSLFRIYRRGNNLVTQLHVLAKHLV